MSELPNNRNVLLQMSLAVAIGATALSSGTCIGLKDKYRADVARMIATTEGLEDRLAQVKQAQIAYDLRALCDQSTLAKMAMTRRMMNLNQSQITQVVQTSCEARTDCPEGIGALMDNVYSAVNSSYLFCPTPETFAAIEEGLIAQGLMHPDSAIIAATYSKWDPNQPSEMLLSQVASWSPLCDLLGSSIHEGLHQLGHKHPDENEDWIYFVGDQVQSACLAGFNPDKTAR